MMGGDPSLFVLDVDTPQLTQALKHLCKVEPRTRLVQLTYESGTLTASMGRTSRDIPAYGTWPQPVSVERRWAEALARNPIEAAITSLRQADGMLYARDFGVKCSIGPWTEAREEHLNEACRILERYNVTKQELRTLAEEADSAKAQLWGQNDGRLIDDIALAWEQLLIHGIEPSDIRRLIDRKSRELWRSRRRSDGDGYSLFARYGVTEQEKRALIESGDLAKAQLWGPDDRPLIDDIALAWKLLATYGVEPSDIRRLMDRKRPMVSE